MHGENFKIYHNERIGRDVAAEGVHADAKSFIEVNF